MPDYPLMLANGDAAELIGAVLVLIVAGIGSLLRAWAKKAQQQRARQEYEQRRRMSEGAVQASPPPEALPAAPFQPYAPQPAPSRQDLPSTPVPPPVPAVPAPPRVRRPIRRPPVRAAEPMPDQPEPQTQTLAGQIEERARRRPTQAAAGPRAVGLAILLRAPSAAARAFVYQEIFALPKAIRQDVPLWDW